MANLNKVMLIGRLTRDPEVKTFADGGKVANVGFAVNNRRKDPVTGAWEEVPVWVDLKAFNRGEGRKLADLFEESLKKGQQAYVEGRLALEEWTGKGDGKKHHKTVVYVDNLQFLEKREEGAAAPRPRTPNGRA
jgi:single-strand DNA-binding protein